MTAREIVTKRLNHEGTAETPYTVPFEGGLYRRMTEYYGDADWQKKKTKQYMACYLNVDTQLQKRIDDKYVTDA